MRFLVPLWLLLLLMNSEVITGQAPGHFYPFGTGDTVNPLSDDGSSSVIPLQEPFQYFGNVYNQIYVNNNAHLTFTAASSHYHCGQSSQLNTMDRITPYCTDLDNRYSGSVSYQQYTSGAVLTQATRDINQYFPTLTFIATSVFVVTWFNVTYIHTNTVVRIQAVLISDDQLSFVLFSYGETPSNSNCDVLAGYETEGSSDYFSLPGSMSYSYDHFPTSSNVGVPGRWAFRVDRGNRCYFNGHHLQVGETLWLNSSCQEKWTCINQGQQFSLESCTSSQVCEAANGLYSCQDLPFQTCTVGGDPHYTSFDKLRFDLQGTCSYTLATVCSNTQDLPHFVVIGQNEAVNGLQVSVTVGVHVNVSGHEVHISRNMPGTVEIDGQTRNLPALLASDTVSVYSNGQTIFVKTDFGLSVSYDGSSVVRITVPKNYSGATCGLCGNYNGDSSDDFLTQSDTVASSALEFGASWNALGDPSCNDGCGGSCPSCTDQTRAQTMCEIIRNSSGPFSSCHAAVDPQYYFNDCVLDVCLKGNSQDALCHSIETYVSACQFASAAISPWRSSTFCSRNCPVNSHYELCGTDCGNTCTSTIGAICNGTCTEGCFCDTGFKRSGGLCVPEEKCGCWYRGFYFQIGETFLNEGCTRSCRCLPTNNMQCHSASCSPKKECEIQNGRLGCYGPKSTCIVSGEPHYYTFDGAVAHFQGSCSYEISRSCGNVNNNGLQIRVVATKEHRVTKTVPFLSEVNVWLDQGGKQTHVHIQQGRGVKVGVKRVQSFPYLISNLAIVYLEQNFVVINASNELLVYFDGSMTLVVRLGPSFQGSVCGMCGNNNGNPADDKSMRDGTPARDDAAFGNSWKSDISSRGCGANDLRADPNNCPKKQQYSQHCGIITKTNGPFQQCHVHIDPEPFFSSCVYDLCSYQSSEMVCSSVRAYEMACTMLELQIPDWRSALSCSK